MTDDDVTTDEPEDEGREVEVTFTWVVRVLAGETIQDAVREYINSVAWAFDEPVSTKDVT